MFAMKPLEIEQMIDYLQQNIRGSIDAEIIDCLTTLKGCLDAERERERRIDRLMCLGGHWERRTLWRQRNE